MKLTIGMATANDHQGVHETICVLQDFHDLTDTELLVVDTTPNTEDGESNAHFCKMSGVRYEAYNGPQGTSAPRNAVFDYAKGELVLCLDSHVVLQKGAIESLLSAVEQHGDENLYQGPLLYDNRNTSTNFDFSRWRGKMWGVWASSFRCQCGKWYSASQQKDQMVLRKPTVFGEVVNKCQCGKVVPLTGWDGHAEVLEESGYRLVNRNDQPFQIPGNGLGLFLASKKHWQRFPLPARGFGGEEGYIHCKYELNGKKTYCVPGALWRHRFSNPGKRKIAAVTEFDKIRNYTIGLKELGLPLNDMKNHFMEAGVPEYSVNAIINDPYNSTAKSVGLTSSFGLRQPPEGLDATGFQKWITQADRWDPVIQEAIAEVARHSETAIEFSNHRSTAVTLAMNVKRHLTSYQAVSDLVVKTQVPRFAKATYLPIPLSKMAIMEPLKEDLALIATFKDQKTLVETLHQCRFAKRIVVTGVLTGWRNKKKDVEVWGALRAFKEQHEEWYTVIATARSGGLIVFSRVEGEWPEKMVPLGIPDGGPGTSLKKYLRRLGFEAGPSCNCNQFAQTMDLNGSAWCNENFDKILDQLESEARGRNIRAFSRILATPLVATAIASGKRYEKRTQKNYEKTRLKHNGERTGKGPALPNFG